MHLLSPIKVLTFRVQTEWSKASREASICLEFSSNPPITPGGSSFSKGRVAGASSLLVRRNQKTSLAVEDKTIL
jgi:hypothetical protein